MLVVTNDELYNTPLALTLLCCLVIFKSVQRLFGASRSSYPPMEGFHDVCMPVPCVCKLFSNSTLHVSTFYKTFPQIVSAKTSKMQEVSLLLGVVTRYLVLEVSYQLVTRVYIDLILLIRTVKP